MDISKDLTQSLHALQSGDRETARRLLAAALRADPHNAQAWLRMSEAVDTEEQKRECLLRVLAIEPDNHAAQAALARLTQQAAQERSRDFQIAMGGRPTTTERGRPGRLEIAATPVDASVPANRDKAERYMQLAGGLLLTLLVGLALLAIALTQVIPQARQGMESSYERPVDTATLWCPSCKREGRPVVLSTRIGASFYRGARANELPHGTRVSVLRYQWSTLERQYYALIAAEGKRGWVPETQIRR